MPGMGNTTHVYDGWNRPIELAAGPRGNTAVVTLPWVIRGSELKVILNATQCRKLATILDAVATGLEKRHQ